LGGEIGLQSAKGEGSVFTVVLPYFAPDPSAGDGALRGASQDPSGTPAKDALSNAQEARSTEQAPGADEASRDITSAGGAPEQPGTDLPGGTVQLLLVEDNGPSRELLPLLLSEIAPQYAVDVAATAEDALTRAAAARYDGFIIDINLGAGMNGVKLMRELRDGPVYADTPMLACTAYALPGDEERFLREGFDAYLGKPYHADDLLEALETMFAT